MWWRKRAPGFAVLVAAAVTLVACRGDAPEITPEQHLIYEVRPAVVRVNTYSTAKFTYPAAEIRAIAAIVSREVPGSAVRRLSGQPTEEISAGTGVSGSGFIINQAGYVLTSASVTQALGTPAENETAIRRNAAIGALVRHFTADPLRKLAKEGRLDPLIERLASAGDAAEITTVRDVELANGERHGFELRRTGEAADSLGVAIVRIRRRNLPVARIGTSAPVRIEDQLWVAGFPSVVALRDEVLGGWLLKDADLEVTLNPGNVTSVGTDPDGRPRFVTNAAIYRGNEGGPAFNRGDGSVIGFALPNEDAVSAKAILPIDAVKGVVEDAGIDFDEGGDFQIAWKAALDQIEEGRYRDARTNLEFANQLFPNYPDLIRLIAEAEREPEDGTFSGSALMVVGLLAFAVVLFGCLAAYFALRARNAGAFEPPIIPPVTRETFVAPSSRDGSERLPETREHLLGKLTILAGERAGERIGLGGSGIRVGREHSMCEIVLDNPKVSRLHAEFVEMDGRVLLIDRNSSNGTYVNDQKIDKRFLEDGDIIYFGGRNAIAVAFNG